jgi:hypothetical protein
MNKNHFGVDIYWYDPILAEVEVRLITPQGKAPISPQIGFGSTITKQEQYALKTDR